MFLAAEKLTESLSSRLCESFTGFGVSGTMLIKRLLFEHRNGVKTLANLLALL